MQTEKEGILHQWKCESELRIYYYHCVKILGNHALLKLSEMFTPHFKSLTASSETSGQMFTSFFLIELFVILQGTAYRSGMFS